MEHTREPRQPSQEVNFHKAPFIIFWEITRACALVCRHCRAAAQPKRNSNELSTQEGFRLLDQMAEFGSPILVITGGDPMMRRDLLDFIRYGIRKGLRVSLAPSATKLVTKKSLKAIKDVGISRISFSVDGSTPALHDEFRQVQGSFQRAMECIRDAREIGLSLQINTTVTRHNVQDLENMAEMVQGLGAALWDVFFLVPTGRGQIADVLSPEEHERIFHWLYHISKTVPYNVKTTLGQPYRRVVMQERKAELAATAESTQWKGPHLALTDGIGSSPKGTNEGNGACFISHVGEVYPSGFLPLPAGNVRETSLVEIYRDSHIFRDLRDPSKLKGKCGRCEFNTICGGSRARAYAMTGDYLEAEPCCVYQPQGQLAGAGKDR
ncbi:MAG: TIGR04053 family radical SAM/SPASM domain-containing protein [Chloroflexi bacterium]|nr:TIGR04053 family radical SAM/SPASM domain-containing protein [Chloroflexota bacterium]